MKSYRILMTVGLSTILAACGGSSTNEAPKFSQASYSFSVNEDQSVDGSVSATDSDPVTYTVANAPSNGVLALNANGTFKYTPNQNFHGADTASLQASDGNSSATATVSFTVNPVNDAPVLQTSFVNVTASGLTVTNLSVTDVDNDTVTFSLVQAPEKGTLTLSESGEVTYQGQELEAISGSFVVNYTDGNISQPIEATIDLKAALATNADKLAYYYSSEHSHLAKAEAVKAQLIDDVAKDQVNAKLAEGYYLAGFENKATNTIDEILTVNEKAVAYRKAALALDQRREFALSKQLRAKSEENYNLYMVEKGLDSISASDATYYLTLNNNYIDANQLEESSQLMARVQLFADAVREEEFNTAYGRFLSAFNNNAQATVEQYFADRTDGNFDAAVKAIQYAADLAAKTGYRLERRGQYKGQPTDRIKAVFVTWAAEHFFNIGAIEQAKDYTALALSLYGQVDYDDNYSYPVSPYAEATINTYQFPLELLTGLYAGLYPEQDSNPALEVLIALGDQGDIADAQSTRYAYQIIYAIENGASVAEAAQPAIDYFVAEGDYRSLYQTLVEYRHVYPRAARLLFANGDAESAKTLLNLASDILTSTEYVDDVRSNTYVTGWLGCNRLTELQGLFGGDPQAQAQKCKTLVETHYTEAAGKFSPSAIYTAHRDLAETLNRVNQTDGIPALTDTMLAIAKAEDDADDKLELQINVANYLNKYGLFEQAKAAMSQALVTVDGMIASNEAEQVEDALDILQKQALKNAQSDTGYAWNHAYMFGIKHNITNIQDYAAHYADAMTAMTDHINRLTAKALTFSDEDVQDMMKDLVLTNFHVGNMATVNELIASNVNGAADVIKLQSEVATLHATLDDIPSSNIALVDTDNDGMPNFFNTGATQDDITASGLTLDEDSDNDGTPDTEDNTPLGG